MTKYNIEGGIDFYSELYKSLDIEENENKTEDDSNLCLISNQPLNEYHFKMNCGHKFNYIPLYLDIKNHKEKYNGMESTVSHLKKDEIRCPYCRNKQTGLLPYYEELGVSKVNGVNYICPNYLSQNNYHSKTKQHKCCQFLTPNPDFNPDGEGAVETNEFSDENCKFFKCSKFGSQICKNDIKLLNIENDELYYCWVHKKQVIKKYKKDIADKAKDEAKKTKIQQKEDAKQKVIEEKQKAKEENQKAKKELEKIVKDFKENSKPKSSEIANTVLGSIDISVNEGCIAILKTGQHKGAKCCCKIVTNNLCKRHLKLVNPTEINAL